MISIHILFIKVAFRLAHHKVAAIDKSVNINTTFILVNIKLLLGCYC